MRQLVKKTYTWLDELLAQAKSYVGLHRFLYFCLIDALLTMGMCTLS